MPKKLLGYNDILFQEKQVELATRNKLSGATNQIPKIIHALFHLSYYFGKNPKKNTPEAEYHSFCWQAFYHLPYNLRACFLLWIRGYYLEASQLVRFMLEVLVKIQYLEKHPEQIEAIWLNKKFGKTKISIKTIFEKTIPGYYEIYYGKLLSGFIHGSAAILVFKTSWKIPDAPMTSDIGLVYKESLATFILNPLVVYILGYLRFFSISFPEGFSSIPTAIKTEYKSSINWCLECIEACKEEYPKTRSWIKLLEPLYKK